MERTQRQEERQEEIDADGEASGTDEESEVARLEQEVRREHEMYLRALADFDNYRRRIEREQATAARAGKREIILGLLDVLDNFDRALQHIGPEPSPTTAGVRAIHRKLLGLLDAQGITPLKSLGETFDPELHEAIGSVQSDEYDEGTVADELQRGYRWGKELLRPARVRVAE